MTQTQINKKKWSKALFNKVQWAQSMLQALSRAICLHISPAPTSRTHYFKVRKQQSTSCWPAMALFWSPTMDWSWSISPQVRHKRSVLFAIDRTAARGGENSICQPASTLKEKRECEQKKSGFCVVLKSDMVTDGKVDWNIPDNFYSACSLMINSSM